MFVYHLIDNVKRNARFLSWIGRDKTTIVRLGGKAWATVVRNEGKAPVGIKAAEMGDVGQDGIWPRAFRFPDGMSQKRRYVVAEEKDPAVNEGQIKKQLKKIPPFDEALLIDLNVFKRAIAGMPGDTAAIQIVDKDAFYGLAIATEEGAVFYQMGMVLPNGNQGDVFTLVPILLEAENE